MAIAIPLKGLGTHFSVYFSKGPMVFPHKASSSVYIQFQDKNSHPTELPPEPEVTIAFPARFGGHLVLCIFCSRY